MKNTMIIGLVVVILLGMAVFVGYQHFFSSKPEKKILYWTDPMIQGDRSDHPGKSPMGRDRVPVYENAQATDSLQLEKNEYYTCPMHPSVHKNAPGACPICGMTLVKKIGSLKGQDEEHGSLGMISISESKQILANVATTPAQRVSLVKDIQAVGKIDYPEPGLGSISMRFPGRLEKLYITYTGQFVHLGDAVADVYSPEATSAEQEYILAKNGYEEVSNAAESIASGASSLLEQSRKKLLNLGLTKKQIDKLDSTKTIESSITIYSPITGIVVKKNAELQHYARLGEDLYDVADVSKLWVDAEIYENEIQLVKIGQLVSIATDADPGKVVRGIVNFISPAIDPASRTAKVRIDVPNTTGELKADMFVTATIRVQLPRTIVVPVKAVISTGARSIVWVERVKGTYEPRIVVLGERNGEFVQVLDGITEGDVVVSSGGYLLDSESQLEMDAGPGSPVKK